LFVLYLIYGLGLPIMAYSNFKKTFHPVRICYVETHTKTRWFMSLEVCICFRNPVLNRGKINVFTGTFWKKKNWKHKKERICCLLESVMLAKVAMADGVRQSSATITNPTVSIVHLKESVHL